MHLFEKIMEVMVSQSLNDLDQSVSSYITDLLESTSEVDTDSEQHSVYVKYKMSMENKNGKYK